MNHEATRQHRRRTCSCSRLEALEAHKRRLARRPPKPKLNRFAASLRAALLRLTTSNEDEA